MREEHLNSCCLCDLESVAEHSGGVSPLRMAQEKREEAMVPFSQGHSSTRVTKGVGYRTRGDLSGPSADELPTPHRREGSQHRGGIVEKQRTGRHQESGRWHQDIP